MPKLDRSHLPIIDQLLTEMNIKEDFADLYLSDRTLFHAFGMADSTVAFYQSESEPAWFCLVSGGTKCSCSTWMRLLTTMRLLED